MKIFKIILLLFCSQILYAQEIKGIILDSDSKKPIEFVNVGIVGGNIGTVSNENGEFTLNGVENKGNLKFSMIGFESQEIIAENWGKEVKTFLLKRKLVALNGVVVKAKNSITKTVGNKTGNKSVVAGFESNDLGSEIGVLMKVKKGTIYIEDVTFNIAFNNFDKVLFRVNVYDVKNKAPNNTLLKEPVYVETSIKEGPLFVDLKKYNLVVNDDFFVSLEWLQDLGDYNLYFSAAFLNKNSFSRKTSQSNWSKVSTVGLGFYSTITYIKD